MKITSSMIVSDAVADTEADLRQCRTENRPSFHVPQTVMVYSSGGARKMRLWSCENHPLPDSITDKDDE